ncbi:hypothetical protein [Streptomyces griseosporeus]|uniref:hypothetical protein n=1 Tax=Streptomyces griseosporeus TaxID=1910 RepID=UPI0036FBE240
MSDDAPTPEPRDAVPPVSLGKADTSAERRDAAPPVSLGKPGGAGGPAEETPAPESTAGAHAQDAAGAARPQEPAPWAAPTDAAPQGPGHTVAGGLPSPALPTVHDQQTIAAMPGAPEGGDPAAGATAQPNDTAAPFTPPTPNPAAPADGTGNPFATPSPGSAALADGTGNPFAPPSPGSAALADGTGNPFAPPSPSSAAPVDGTGNPFAAPADGTANPFAPPASGTEGSGGPVNPFAPPAPAAASGPGTQGNPFAPPGAGNPFAPPAPGEPVPPPPIAPEGPGQVPYGYPAGGYGYPPQHGYGGAHSPQAQPVPGGYYGWPGMVPAPSNGIGTAGLVVGIVSAAIFCLWPVAIVLGILAIVFGAVGRSRANRGQATNAGQALAGIICGVAGLVLGIGMMVLVLAT